MNYKLLAVDMDGTLLNEDGLVTERTRSAVLSAMEQGVLFVPSTGRPFCGMEKINALFGQGRDLPFILFNGATVKTGESQKLLFFQSLGFQSAKEIYRMGIGHNVPVILWVGEHLFVSEDCDYFRTYQGITGIDRRLITDMDAFQGQEITKMLWVVLAEDAPAFQAEMNEYFNGNASCHGKINCRGNVNCHTSRPTLLEFVDAGASKGRALQEIGRTHGIAASEMIAVGDGYNDVSMLEYAGLGVAMANAPADIQAMCQYVTLSNEEDGVAAVIEKYIL